MPSLARPVGNVICSRQRVPLPVSLRNCGVKEMLKLVLILELRPRFT
jgi:hypothetical protein